MRRWLLAVLLLVACQAPPGAAPAPAPEDLAPSIAIPAPAHCHARVVEAPALVDPDPGCTPGIRNPDVTQENIDQTICTAGWTATVRPPASYTGRLKVQQMGEYGLPGPPADYEEDHLVPLELGGAPRDPLNLWPEPGGAPNPKDGLENYLHSMVCDHRLLLGAAQDLVAKDWVIAYREFRVQPDWHRRCRC